MYSGGKHGPFAAPQLPARTYTGTAACWLFRLLLCRVFNDKVEWTLTRVASLGEKSSAFPEALEPGALVMHSYPRLAICAF